MKKILLLLCLLSIPCLIFTNIWQSFSFEKLHQEITLLEQQQENSIESNKRAIASIAVLSSPARITKIAVTKLGLRKVDPEEILYMSLPKADERDG